MSVWVLAFGLACAHSSVLAAGNAGWNYAGTTYQTKDAALAAMHDASSANGQLTQESVYGADGDSTTYQYIAPITAATVTSVYCPSQASLEGFTCGPGSDNSSTEAEAWQVVNLTVIGQNLSTDLEGDGTGCIVTAITEGTTWSFVGFYAVKHYTYSFQQDISPSGYQCQGFNQNPPFITRYDTDSCPTGQTLTNLPGTMFPTQQTVGCSASANVDYVSGPLFECPDSGSPPTVTGDPCDVSSGDLAQTETDYLTSSPGFTRYYHSATLESFHGLGTGWTDNYDARLVLQGSKALLRPDGHHDALTGSGLGPYVTMSGSGIHVLFSEDSDSTNLTGILWTAYLKNGSQEVYDGNGLLLRKISPAGLVTRLTYYDGGTAFGRLASVTDMFGHALSFTYDLSRRLSVVTEPDGSTITYGYDGNNNLISVIYPDQRVRQYQYANSAFPHNLTGILDESSNQYLTVTYDPITGAATSSQLGGTIGAQAVSIAYSTNGAVATVAIGNGVVETDTYSFTHDPNYAPRATSLSRNNLVQSFTVPPGAEDPQRRVTESVDANGNITKFVYDTDHLTSKTEAFGTADVRTTSYQYLTTTSALPSLITEPLRRTSYIYYPGSNNVQTRTVTDTTVTPNVSRTWPIPTTILGRY